MPKNGQKKSFAENPSISFESPANKKHVQSPISRYLSFDLLGILAAAGSFLSLWFLRTRNVASSTEIAISSRRLVSLGLISNAMAQTTIEAPPINKFKVQNLNDPTPSKADTVRTDNPTQEGGVSEINPKIKKQAQHAYNYVKNHLEHPDSNNFTHLKTLFLSEDHLNALDNTQFFEVVDWHIQLCKNPQFAHNPDVKPVLRDSIEIIDKVYFARIKALRKTLPTTDGFDYTSERFLLQFYLKPFEVALRDVLILGQELMSLSSESQSIVHAILDEATHRGDSQHKYLKAHFYNLAVKGKIPSPEMLLNMVERVEARIRYYQQIPAETALLPFSGLREQIERFSYTFIFQLIMEKTLDSPSGVQDGLHLLRKGAHKTELALAFNCIEKGIDPLALKPGILVHGIRMLILAVRHELVERDSHLKTLYTAMTLIEPVQYYDALKTLFALPPIYDEHQVSMELLSYALLQPPKLYCFADHLKILIELQQYEFADRYFLRWKPSIDQITDKNDLTNYLSAFDSYLIVKVRSGLNNIQFINEVIAFYEVLFANQKINTQDITPPSFTWRVLFELVQKFKLNLVGDNEITAVYNDRKEILDRLVSLRDPREELGDSKFEEFTSQLQQAAKQLAAPESNYTPVVIGVVIAGAAVATTAYFYNSIKRTPSVDVPRPNLSVQHILQPEQVLLNSDEIFERELALAKEKVDISESKQLNEKTVQFEHDLAKARKNRNTIYKNERQKLEQNFKTSVTEITEIINSARAHFDKAITQSSSQYHVSEIQPVETALLGAEQSLENTNKIILVYSSLASVEEKLQQFQIVEFEGKIEKFQQDLTNAIKELPKANNETSLKEKLEIAQKAKVTAAKNVDDITKLTIAFSLNIADVKKFIAHTKSALDKAEQDKDEITSSENILESEINRIKKILEEIECKLVDANSKLADANGKLRAAQVDFDKSVIALSEADRDYKHEQKTNAESAEKIRKEDRKNGTLLEKLKFAELGQSLFKKYPIRFDNRQNDAQIAARDFLNERPFILEKMREKSASLPATNFNNTKTLYDFLVTLWESRHTNISQAPPEEDEVQQENQAQQDGDEEQQTSQIQQNEVEEPMQTQHKETDEPRDNIPEEQQASSSNSIITVQTKRSNQVPWYETAGGKNGENLLKQKLHELLTMGIEFTEYYQKFTRLISSTNVNDITRSAYRRALVAYIIRAFDKFRVIANSFGDSGKDFVKSIVHFKNFEALRDILAHYNFASSDDEIVQFDLILSGYAQGLCKLANIDMDLVTRPTFTAFSNAISKEIIDFPHNNQLYEIVNSNLNDNAQLHMRYIQIMDLLEQFEGSQINDPTLQQIFFIALNTEIASAFELLDKSMLANMQDKTLRKQLDSIRKYRNALYHDDAILKKPGENALANCKVMMRELIRIGQERNVSTAPAPSSPVNSAPRHGCG